jgi:hypothetical protein
MAWSGLFDGLIAAPNVVNGPYALLIRRGHRVARKVAQIGRTRGGAIAMGGEFALPGEVFTRVVAPTDTQTNVTALGGKRTKEVITPTQLSEANLITDVNEANQPSSYPTVKGGGGGGKIAADGSVLF